MDESFLVRPPNYLGGRETTHAAGHGQEAPPSSAEPGKPSAPDYSFNGKFFFFFGFRQLIKGQVPPVGLGGNKQAINAIKLGGGGRGGRRFHILRLQRFGQRINTKT